ncbi:MAG: hypothetical protein AB7T37_10500 [Dehalococcoidia bacterium]
MATELKVDWGEAELAEGDRRTWLGAWLVNRDGVEGEFFYDGPGGKVTNHTIPSDAVGLRLRSWPPESPERVLGRQPLSTKPFYFDGYDGAAVKALELA